VITIFTIPRPFVGEFDHIQRNALRSWLLLKPRPEILLFGAEEGVAEVANELNIPVFLVERNDEGTPLVNDALDKARSMAANDILVMANCDNIYLSDFIPAVQKVARAFPRFLMIGRRWDIKVDNLIDFDSDWENRIRQKVAETGTLHHKAAVDFLVFRDGGWWGEIPPFAVGRTTYDSWLVARTWKQGIPTVDVTWTAMVVHQDHALKGIRHNREAHRNRELHGDAGRGGVGHANWRTA